MATTMLPQTASGNADEQEDCKASNSKKNLVDNSNTKRNNKNQGENRKRENHHRRKPSKKKRKWKPYSKMTWEEKKAVEEREKIRADRIRGEMMDRGRPVAPYNTTQFIMAEHDPYEEDTTLDAGIVRENESSNDQTLNEEMMDESIEAQYTDSPHMAPEFISQVLVTDIVINHMKKIPSQDFSEAYERVQEESLSTMTRDDLVKEHLSLERTLSYLQQKLADEKNINNSYSIKVENLEEELERLQKDNDRLVRENMRLIYGNEAVDTGIDQTSDYEYEVPTSDPDAVKYSEDYNDIGDQPVDPSSREESVSSCSNECECNTFTSRPSNSSLANSMDTPRSAEADYEDFCEASDSEAGEKRKKRRNVKKKDTPRRCDDDVTSSSYDDTVPSNQSQSPSLKPETTVKKENGVPVPAKDSPSPKHHSNENGDQESPSQNNPIPMSDENSRSCSESQRSSTMDVIMQSQKTVESMDVESLPSGGKTLSSASMHSLTPEQ